MSSKPRPYDLSDASERHRLIHELVGYMRISRKHGTDRPGREYAYTALMVLEGGMERGTFAIMQTIKKERTPFVFDEKEQP